ncbi:hypothetical protein N0B31_03400 [Salinirubellus salinus]|uniref:Lipoprotein n=1 Tax=Salinirubellus salinus TaxID=1364945 RepID=A0A9E7U8Y4_9EURY|nr:hypothetical protein [Salinirubellus salinus]UWM55336.1 hypothetical protein N0B31_03400 [Salinirubellus salinus]
MRAVLLALCLVLAGCGGALAPADPDTPSPTVTPVEVPADAPSDAPAALREGLDVRALARGHAAALAGRPYRWRVFVDRPTGEVASGRRVVDALTVSVAGPTRYRSQRSETVLQSGVGVRITRTETYADGETAYTRVRNRRLDTVRYEARRVAVCAGGEGPPLDAAESVIVRYLAVRNASVTFESTRTGPRYRIVDHEATHPSLSGVRNYRVEALVTPEGVVREVEATYDPETQHGTATVTAGFAYAGVDTTTVTPPRWAPQAQAVTAGLDLPATVPVGTPTETPTHGAGETDVRGTGTPIPALDCGGLDCETFPGGEAVGQGRCAG